MHTGIRNCKAWLLAGILAAGASQTMAQTMAQVPRDPFEFPSSQHSTAPLRMHSVLDLAVDGVMVSQHKVLAFVRLPDQSFHIVRVGNLVGTEKKKVISIDPHGVWLEDSGDGLLLPVAE